MSVRSISRQLEVDYSGLLKEIKRGQSGNMALYSAKIAQARYEAHIEASKRPEVFDTLEKRFELKYLFDTLGSGNRTAKLLGCSQSSVWRELQRGLYYDENNQPQYDPVAAHRRRLQKKP